MPNLSQPENVSLTSGDSSNASSKPPSGSSHLSEAHPSLSTDIEAGPSSALLRRRDNSTLASSSADSPRLVETSYRVAERLKLKQPELLRSGMEFATLKTSRMMRGYPVTSVFGNGPGPNVQPTSPAFAVAQALGNNGLVATSTAFGASVAMHNWKDQMNELKRLRAEHLKQFKKMEEKNKLDQEEKKQNLNKEYRKLKTQMACELTKLAEYHANECEQERKTSLAEEHKLVRKLEANTKTEIKVLKKTKDFTTTALNTISNPTSFSASTSTASTGFFAPSEPQAQALMPKTNHLELELRDRSHQLRVQQLRHQHDCEQQNQRQMHTKQRQELEKRHAEQKKLMPKNLKAREEQIRKMFRATLNSQKKQYKHLREEQLRSLQSSGQGSGRNSMVFGSGTDGTNKAEEQRLLEYLREEEERRQAELHVQYNEAIQLLHEKHRTNASRTQNQEVDEFNERLNSDTKLLVQCHKKQQEEVIKLHEKENQELRKNIRQRKEVLEAAIQAKVATLQAEAETQRKALADQHKEELRLFDLESEKLSYTPQLVNQPPAFWSPPWAPPPMDQQSYTVGVRRISSTNKTQLYRPGINNDAWRNSMSQISKH
ncbi:hypothetical protein Ciccas_008770 [Cichlidogyrus casuarinus]|uniref:non-specific serine/threonine protein kinase n=1 Tax=Cichlidogyrus casuarinus TaxID=1844966 RepID=A0ABD2PZE2_9PLAT